MNQFHRLFKIPRVLIPALAIAFIAGCSGGLDPILGGTTGAAAPTVTAVTPANTTPPTVEVPITTTLTATFSKVMTASTINSTSFSLACPSGVPVPATVTYDAPSKTATLTPTLALPANTLCVATLTTGVQDSMGIALAANYVWSFMTMVLPDTTRPTVVSTVPANLAVAVATNTQVSASFSEAMDATSINGNSFTVMNTTLGTAVTGTVSYAAAAMTAVFTPAATLPINTLFTATIASTAKDLAGNRLSGNAAPAPAPSNYTWTFTTGATTDTTAPTVTAFSPADGATNVCLRSVVSATFSEAMDPNTLNDVNFRVTTSGAAVLGTVAYDAPSMTASFTPADPAGFAINKTFSVILKGGPSGIRDLAGNPLAADLNWTFSTATQACASAFNLRSAATFAIISGATGITNGGTLTSMNGNAGSTGVCIGVSGLHDATRSYTESVANMGVVNGTIYCGPPAPGTVASLAVATKAHDDAQTSYTALAATPAGTDPGAGELGTLTLVPGTYTAALGSFKITTGDLILDGQGDTNATWVFQANTTLTVGLPATPIRVITINGARARNVFWQVGTTARIEDRSVLTGTLISNGAISISTAGRVEPTNMNGRAISLTSSVSTVNTVISVP
jgi:hypothetical protein